MYVVVNKEQKGLCGTQDKISSDKLNGQVSLWGCFINLRYSVLITMPGIPLLPEVPHSATFTSSLHRIIQLLIYYDCDTAVLALWL